MRARTSSRSVATRSRQRSRSHIPKKSSGSFSGPLVAFLLVASFGILFAGCGGVKGPNEQLADTTFTAADMEKFLEDDAEGVAFSSTGAVALEEDDLVVADSGSGMVDYPALDPALARTYAAIRMQAGVSGAEWKVINAFLTLRAGPDASSAVLGRLENGNTLTLIEFVNANWAKVKTAEGVEGFVSAPYIAKSVSSDRLEQEKAAFQNVWFVDYTFVNVRAGKDVSTEKIGQIPGRAFVRPVAVEGDWAKVVLDGKEGYVSTQFLSRFEPQFLVRQNTFDLPVLHYNVDQPGMMDALKTHVAALRQAGAKFVTMREFFDVLLLQEQKVADLQPKSVVVAISGATPETVRQLSIELAQLGIRATFFVQTRHVGISGISERELLTLQANGFDVQSAGHTGDDLRGLTNAQLKLELAQSRALLEEMTHKTVFAVAYPQGSVNSRVLESAEASGYLMGIAAIPGTGFTRTELLRMPSVTVTAGMTAEEIVQAVQ